MKPVIRKLITWLAVAAVLAAAFAVVFVVAPLRESGDQQVPDEALLTIPGVTEQFVPLEGTVPQDCEGMSIAAQNERFQLLIDVKTAEIALVDLDNGEIWRSNPADRENDVYAKGDNAEKLASQLIIRCFDSAEREHIYNTFAGSVESGQYAIRTVDDGIKVDYIPPNNIPDAFALAAPTGAALANFYGRGECDVVDCATGTMYGGANFLFTEPEEAVTPPTLAGTKVYELAVTDKPFGSYSIDAIQPHQIANKPGGNDNFGSVFFVNKKIQVHQLGRIYVDPSDVPSKDMGYRPLADSRANNGTHEVALFRIKNASAADTLEANNAALRDSANWEKVASVTVAMNGSAAVDGFNWTALEQPVEIDAGMYVLVTVEDGGDLIMTPPGQAAYAWPAKEAVTHTGVTVGSKYAEGKYADAACAAGGDGNMYGGANMTFTEVTTPPVTPVKPELKGEQVYNLGSPTSPMAPTTST